MKHYEIKEKNNLTVKTSPSEKGMVETTCPHTYK